MLGEIVTDQFDAFNVALCNSFWYLFPNELQRMLLIFMGIAQKPAYVRGYGSTVFTREAFKKVGRVIFACIQFSKN